MQGRQNLNWHGKISTEVKGLADPQVRAKAVIK